MKQTFRWRTAAILLVAIVLPIMARAGEPLSSLVEEALSSNPSLLAARESVSQAEIQIEQARSGLLPTAALSASYTRPSYIPEANLGSGRMLKFGTDNQINTQLSANYPFFTWGRTQASVHIAELNAQTARDAEEQARRAVTLAVARSYFGISLAKEALRWAEENASLLDNQVALVKAQYKGGFASDFDVLRMEVELSGAQSEIVNRRKQVNRLEVALNRLLGRPLTAPVDSDISLPESPPGDLDTTEVSTAVLQHLELKMLRRSFDLYTEQEKITKTGWLRPMPSAFFSWVIRNGQFPDVEAFQDSWSLGVSLSIPLFDGWLTKRKLEEITISRRSLQAKEQDKNAEIEQSILDSRLDLAEALQQIEIGRKSFEQANASYTIALNRYKNGGIGSLDLIEAQRTLRRTRLTLMGYRFDAVVKWCSMRDAEYLPYIEAFDE
ncbi:MAG: TolC family protein [bacterium]